MSTPSHKGQYIPNRVVILLSDEPYSVMDGTTRNEFQRLLKEIIAESTMTTLHVTLSVSTPVTLEARRLIIQAGSVHEIPSESQALQT